MSEQINEQLSALLDGELPEAELSLLLRQIAKQPDVLEKAYAIQQARLCVQGETPLSLNQTLDFSSRVQAAIRNDQHDSKKTSIRLGHAHQAVAQASFMDSTQKSEISSQQLSQTQFTHNRTASNESRWRPVIGAGIAAAVALVAVNAWQSQIPNSEIANPIAVEIEDKPFSNLEISPQRQSPAKTLQAIVPVESLESAGQDNNSYTVPNFEDLNVDSPLAFSNGFRQVNYADYLLQNNVAPQSTSRQLTRFAEEQRAIIYGEFYDPRTGQVAFTIRPIKD